MTDIIIYNEEEVFQRLNEIWGDDDDKVYEKLFDFYN
jgi:hypothetical protein